MTRDELAAELVAGCREHRERENLQRLYAADAVSVEASDRTGGTAEGLAAIEGKHDWWDQNFVVHDQNIDGPFPHGDDRFAVIFDSEVENAATKERNRMREVAVYHVGDGKIVREEFFYGA